MNDNSENSVTHSAASAASDIGKVGKIGHAAPSSQPTQVHQLTDKLFSAYEVDGGSVRLAGCVFEDRPFICLRPLTAGSTDPGGNVESSRCYDRGGNLIAAADLPFSFDEVANLEHPPHPWRDQDVWDCLSAVWESNRSDTGLESLADAAVTFVWCKEVSGKLSVNIGERSEAIPFSEWATRILEPGYQPPPLTCPYTGKQSHQIAATDDGKITVLTAIDLCEVSGHRALESDLIRCSVSGTRALQQFMSICESSGKPVLESTIGRCRRCNQSVSPNLLKRGVCEACHALRKVSKSDAEVRRLVDSHRGLGIFNNWRRAESHSNVLFRAADWTKQYLLVVGKDQNDIRYVGVAPRWSSRFQELDETQVRDLLG